MQFAENLPPGTGVGGPRVHKIFSRQTWGIFENEVEHEGESPTTEQHFSGLSNDVKSPSYERPYASQPP